MGYRWYDTRQVAVAYPFGFGLSYASFVYSDLRLESTADGFDVSFVLSNTSNRDAEEVAQVYVTRPNSRLERPAKELKGFRRVMVKAGERKLVTIQIRHSDLSDWNEATQSWKLWRT